MTHVHWVSPATYERLVEQLAAPLDPRTAAQVLIWWGRLVALRKVTSIRANGMIDSIFQEWISQGPSAGTATISASLA